MAEKIIPPIPCSHCGEPFTPSLSQWKRSRHGKRVYHSKECWIAGRPATPRGPYRKQHTILERFLKYTRRLPNGCLEWTGAVMDNGYGTMGVEGRHRLAHHVAKFLETGIWPDTKKEEGDHTCHVPENCRLGVKCPHRRCVECTHVKLVARHSGGNQSAERSNGGRAWGAMQRAKTHCIHGHELTPENTYISNDGYRHCKTCRRDAEFRYRTRTKALSRPSARMSARDAALTPE